MTELIIIIGTNIFIQNGKKINFLTLIKFHKIIIPPMIEKGSKPLFLLLLLRINENQRVF